MKGKHSSLKKTIFIFSLFFFLILTIIPKTLSVQDTHEISTFDDLVTYANLSKEEGYNDDIYILKNDIIITTEDQGKLEYSDIKYVSFGSSEYPFIGTFDGQGYTISNLQYDSNLSVISDTGLFSITGSGAVIKNIVIDNANLQADYRGGIVAGYAEGTTFENIVVKNSHLFVSASNNVVSLITDGGIRAGAIVGEAKNSILYNCESENNIVNTNNTVGVAALSGKDLTLGGLVGISDSTLIEYSRVIGGTVKNYYDVAVGALGGNTLYVGGIVGKMKNSSKVIDCFSTASLEYYCATYVSVGSGNTGHIGGISASVSGSTCEIVRSHYAGKAESKQYNAVLVIPIIQNNVNISGIVDVFEGGSVVNSYFKPSINSNVDMKVLGNSNSTSSYGPISDEKYIDKNFWASQFYDLVGNIKRNTDYSSLHYNKWIIDNNLGIPVHGKSVSATLDFKNAGKAVVDKTDLIDKQVSTSNPYNFAVQGVGANESKVNLNATVNDGYRFLGWYKQENIATWELEENHEYFEKVFASSSVVSTNTNYNDVLYSNNDLYIARYQANVVFYDINGNIIDIDTGDVSTNADNENNWYDYGNFLPNVDPKNKPSSETAKLIGWTTTKSSEAGGGYSGITSTQLTNIKNGGDFYQTGDEITSTLDLYPVYVDLVSNVITIFEGNEMDSNSNKSVRDGVGETHVSKNENDDVVLTVVGANNDGSFPTGYRFLGWYNDNGVRVSTNTTYVIEEIDLAKANTFTAKFEYLVEYYSKATSQGQNKFEDSTLYKELWQEYGTDFQDIGGPAYMREDVVHWGTSHAEHDSESETSDKYSGKIYAPLKVYSHNVFIGTGGDTTYAVYMDTDFPGSGTIKNDGTPSSSASYIFTPTNDRYKLMFWTLERKNARWTYIDNPMNTGTLNLAISAVYKGRAMVTADILFHLKDDSIVTVTRRYGNTILMSADQTFTYYYPHYTTDEVVDTDTYDDGTISSAVTLEASPTNESMHKDGYAFLGWISSGEVAKDSEEWNKIYDVTDDVYCTSDVNNALAYLIDDTDIITEAVDLYPVYARYNITTMTNITANESAGINAPSNPTYTLTEYKNGKATIKLTFDANTYVVGSSGDKYVLTAFKRVYEDGREEDVPRDSRGKLTYDIVAGCYYTFIAYYEPYTIIYHLNDINTSVSIRNFGEVVGDIPDPTYDIDSFSDKHLFVGYTSKISDTGYHSFDSITDYDNSKLLIINSEMPVSESLELYPVYVKSGININSNIDSYLSNTTVELTDVRNIVREGNDKFKLVVNETVIDNYYFMGWYKNYNSESDLGELATENTELILSEMESLETATYTAVYKLIYTVNYFDKDGNLLHSVDVPKHENRTFVIDKIDESGNTVATPIDYEVFEAIYNTLPLNESFVSWQWVKNDNSVVKWEEFSNQVINSDMNLYPIIIKVTMEDSNGNAIDLVGSETSEADVILGVKNNNLIAAFNSLYSQPSLNTHIEQIAYGTLSPIVTNIDNVNIEFYSENILEPELIGSETTNLNGNALFNFYKVFDIYISENSNINENDAFVLKIVNEKNINISILDFSLINGETKKIKLPYGNYRIIEENNWAWRYNNKYNYFLQLSNYQIEPIRVEKNITNNKWFDNMTVNR